MRHRCPVKCGCNHLPSLASLSNKEMALRLEDGISRTGRRLLWWSGKNSKQVVSFGGKLNPNLMKDMQNKKHNELKCACPTGSKAPDRMSTPPTSAAASDTSMLSPPNIQLEHRQAAMKQDVERLSSSVCDAAWRQTKIQSILVSNAAAEPTATTASVMGAINVATATIAEAMKEATKKHVTVTVPFDLGEPASNKVPASLPAMASQACQQLWIQVENLCHKMNLDKDKDVSIVRAVIKEGEEAMVEAGSAGVSKIYPSNTKHD